MAVILFQKDQRPYTRLYKSIRMYFWLSYYGFNGRILGKTVGISWLAYPGVQALATANLIL